MDTNESKSAREAVKAAIKAFDAHRVNCVACNGGIHGSAHYSDCCYLGRVYMDLIEGVSRACP